MNDATTNQWGIDQAFATLSQLTVHSDSAKGAMKFLRAEIERLQREAEDRSQYVSHLEGLVYVPGLWRCPKCDFRLTRIALNVVTGTASADDTTGQLCPNCVCQLWRVSERDAGNDLAKRCESLQLANTEINRAFVEHDRLLSAANRRVAELEQSGSATSRAAAAAGAESTAALSSDAHWLAWAARADKQRCLCRSPNAERCASAIGITAGECACVCHGAMREGQS